jgi:hypothetical protein
VFLRPAKWYRKQLDRNFQSIGGGVFIRKPLPITLWALERA